MNDDSLLQRVRHMLSFLTDEERLDLAAVCFHLWSMAAAAMRHSGPKEGAIYLAGNEELYNALAGELERKAKSRGWVEL